VINVDGIHLINKVPLYQGEDIDCHMYYGEARDEHFEQIHRLIYSDQRNNKYKVNRYMNTIFGSGLWFGDYIIDELKHICPCRRKSKLPYVEIESEYLTRKLVAVTLFNSSKWLNTLLSWIEKDFGPENDSTSGNHRFVSDTSESYDSD
jgi:hypothetical protein